MRDIRDEAFITNPIEAVRCLTCDHIADADDATSPLYECGSCGEMFDNMVKSDSHRCPSCNKFGSRVADRACPECGEGEVEDIQAWEYGGEYFEAKEGVTLEQILADAEAEKKVEAERKAKRAKGPDVLGTKTMGEVVPGDRIIVDWPNGATVETVSQVWRKGDEILFSFVGYGGLRHSGPAYESIGLGE